MKVKNLTISSLAQTKVLDIEYTDIPAKQAYKVFKFKRGLEKAAAELNEQRNEIIKTALGDNFDKVAEYEAARQAGDTSKVALSTSEYNRIVSELAIKTSPMLDELYNEEVEVPFTLIPFEVYFVLKIKNKDICTDAVDNLLAGVLFDDGENKEDNGNNTEKEKAD